MHCYIILFSGPSGLTSQVVNSEESKEEPILMRGPPKEGGLIFFTPGRNERGEPIFAKK